MNTNQQGQVPDSVPPELTELYEMGAAGRLWTLEFTYDMDKVQHLVMWRNLTEVQLMARRNKMFTVGLTKRVKDEPGHWRIICPVDIVSVSLHRQAGHFPSATQHEIAPWPKRKKGTVPDKIPDELKQWYELGADGKLYTLQFEYASGGERKLYTWRNMTEAKLMARRANLFSVGLTIPVGGDPGHWVVICPIDILKVDLYQQTGYFSG